MVKTIMIFNDFGPNCISLSEGSTLYLKLIEAMKNGEKTILDFAKVDILATPFLNAAIGQLIKDFPKEKISELIEIKNPPKELGSMLNSVIANAEKFYHGGDAYKKSISETLKRNIGQSE